MIGLRDKVIVRLEIDIEMIKGELPVFRQNAVDHPLEKLITMWGDQIKQTRLMVLLRRLENSDGKRTPTKNSGGQAGDI